MKSIAYTRYPGFLSAVGLLLCWSVSGPVSAETVNVAVASNFATAMERVKQDFEAHSTHNIALIRGSSGRHFAQITSGAPFDLFLSADVERPRQLELAGLVSHENRVGYAIGQLVLWGLGNDNRITAQSLQDSSQINRLAIANPRLAPYGVAALETLRSLGLWTELESKLVRGENVSQAFQFVYSGNAELGFVALSQALAASDSGSFWRVPTAYYQPIRQEMVLLSDSAAARELFDYLQSESMLPILESMGYLQP